MSLLLDKARSEAQRSRPLDLGEGDLPDYREGKAFAVELLAELRAGDAHPRLLFIAISMAPAAGAAFSAGVHTELQRRLCSTCEVVG